MKQNTQKLLEQQTLVQMIDSVDLESTSTVEGLTVNPMLIGGTVARGNRGTLKTTFEIIKTVNTQSTSWMLFPMQRQLCCHNY